MALKLNFTGDDGVNHPESYWRIVEQASQYGTAGFSIVLDGWHNQQARIDEKKTIGRKVVSLTTLTITTTSDLRDLEYNAVKGISPWDTATDV